MHLNSNKSFHIKLIYASYIIAPILFFSSKKTIWNNDSFIISKTKGTLVQIDQQIFSSKNSFSQSIDNYLRIVETNQKNKKLQIKINELNTTILSLKKVIATLGDNKIDSYFLSSIKTDLIVAQVFSNHGALVFSKIRINKGKEHGIKVGLPVITTSGIIGKIISTDNNHSEIKTILDNNFTIDAIIERTRIPGLVRGNRHNSYRFQVEKKIDIKVGDRIVTSGLIGSFPKNLPIGIVSKIIINHNNLLQSIYIEPSVDIKTAEQVLVVKRNLEHISTLLKLSKN
jgi:rod shape-determining protein MreC